jgi:hypothetical protein
MPESVAHDLYATFSRLSGEPPANTSYLTASPIGSGMDLAAVDAGGDWFLLLASPERSPGPPLSKVFQHISLMTQKGFDYILNGEPRSDFYTAVQLTSAPHLEKAFALFGGALLNALEMHRDTVRVTQAVAELSELLMAAESAGTKTLQGLWAELHFILSSVDRSNLIEAWHQSQNAIFDFSMPELNIEVKSTLFHERRHHFSLSQLEATKTTKVISYRLVEDSAGQSVWDLASSIAFSVDETRASILWKKLVGSLGQEMDSIDGVRFALRSELEPLELRAIDIQRVTVPEGSSIRDVRFSVLLG